MSRSLLLRILSAAILIPVAVAAVWAGGPWFSLVVGIFAVGMAWEWGGICNRAQPIALQSPAIIAAVAIPSLLAAAGWLLPGLLVAATGAGAIAVLGAGRVRRAAWLAPAGTLYIAVAVLAVLHLRLEGGLWPTLWLFVVVWATDIAAYAAGRSIGGPLLAPALSPRKTWSGLLGGATAAAAAGAAMAAGGGPPLALAAGLGFALAVVAQAGDLAESAAKRYVGVKDASGLIPGHGGVLDRLDGLMAAALAFVVLRQCLGEELLGWR